MKRRLLFMLTAMFMVSSIEAININPNLDGKDYPKFKKAKPIQFVEKGITFILFPNGELKYKMQRKIRKNYNNRSTKRYAYRKPLRRFNVVRDRWGKVRRIGRVNLMYNQRGKVSRIGAVKISYQHRKLRKVGGLHIKYRPNGKVQYFGRIKPTRSLSIYQ